MWCNWNTSPFLRNTLPERYCLNTSFDCLCSPLEKVTNCEAFEKVVSSALVYFLIIFFSSLNIISFSRRKQIFIIKFFVQAVVMHDWGLFLSTARWNLSVTGGPGVMKIYLDLRTHNRALHWDHQIIYFFQNKINVFKLSSSSWPE